MKQSLILLSLLALVAIFVVAALVLRGDMSLVQSHLYVLAATVLWFGTAVFWMK
ncbi:MAG: hypothetical protein OHK0039_29780 [Bacteroidia bacterium]